MMGSCAICGWICEAILVANRSLFLCGEHRWPAFRALTEKLGSLHRCERCGSSQIVSSCGECGASLQTGDR
jgi:hypothetical protein